MKSSFYISGVIVSYGIIDVFNENCMHLLILNVSCLITELILIDIYTLTHYYYYYYYYGGDAAFWNCNRELVSTPI